MRDVQPNKQYNSARCISDLPLQCYPDTKSCCQNHTKHEPDQSKWLFISLGDLGNPASRGSVEQTVPRLGPYSGRFPKDSDQNKTDSQ